MQELNLIPYEAKKQKEKTMKSKDKVAIGVIIAAVLFVAAYVPFEMLKGTEKKENELKLQYASYEKSRTDNASCKKDIESLQKYIASFDNISKAKVVASDKIAGIQKYITSDIVVDNLSYGNKLINISAHTTNYASISIFAANLELSKEFTGVRVSSINYNTDSKSYNFTVTMNY